MRLSYVLLSGVSTLIAAAPALAQEPAARNSAAPAPDERATPAADVAATPTPETDQPIVVTGSRIPRNGDASPSPVTVVTTEDILKVQPGATLAEALNTLPAFAGARGAASNPTATGSAAGGNSSANQLNLRNLGPVRTLVLMDGKRVPPTLYNGVVDVDIIPQLLVDRVDVVTGGVSAVYGSDAVSGVVNYIINRKLQGFRVDASSGISQRGDAARTDFAAAYGVQVASNLHLSLSYEYRQEDGIPYRTDRDYLNQIGVTGSGTAANPFVLQSNLRQKDFPFGGLVVGCGTGCTVAGQVFRSSEVMSPFVAGTLTGTPAIQIGGDGGYWNSSLLASMKAHQLFGRLDYALPGNLRGYAQLSATFKTNASAEETNRLTNVVLSKSNAFLSPAAQAALLSGSGTTFTLSKFINNQPRVNAEAKTSQWVAATGVEGKVDKGHWNLDYTHGESLLRTSLNNVINRQKLSAALDAVAGPGGAPVCNITITNPGLANDCVALNVFGPNAASAAAYDYVTDTIHYRAKTMMDDVSAQLSDQLAQGWAGPITGALSAEWRRTAFSSNSDGRPIDLVSCTGLRFNCTTNAQKYEFVFGEAPQTTSQTVWEVAGEVDVPLLRDLPFIRALSVNGAVRYTRYNTSGEYWTWKAGLDWQVSGALRFRATRSRDIRAPTLFDLFGPKSVVNIPPNDRLVTTPNPAFVPSINISNPNLKAEIANTLTAGVVWRPLPRLSFAVDAYKIKISNAITPVNGSTDAFQNACYDSGGSSPYCALQTRPIGFARTPANMVTANTVTSFISTSLNLASVETWGVDAEMNYSGRLFSRPMSLRLLGAWQPHLRTIQPGLTTLDQAGVAFGINGFAATPSVRLSAFFRFQPAEHFTVDIAERWRNPMKLGADPTQVWMNNRIGAFGTTSVNLEWDFDGSFGRAAVYFNVQNLFDANPPAAGSSANGARAGLYDGFALGDDVRGRYFTAGVRLKF